MSRLKTCLALCVAALSIGWCVSCDSAETDNALDSLKIDGETLGHWIAQATADDGPEDLDKTVAALGAATACNDPAVKVAAADALSVLGPRAKAALPALLAQFGHKSPWVRVSCQGAVASIGKEAVPALIEVFENNTGGPRIRAAFVLGRIAADAKPAVPVILRIMKEESTTMQQRFVGVLQQIDPERFAVKSGLNAGKAVRFDAGTGSPVGVERGDWPEFHGPARDSICREKGLLQEWPEGGPKLLWTLEGLGRGYSTVSIANSKLFTMGDRAVGDDEAQFVIAFDLRTRKELWATRIGPPHTDGGPRCTPAVDGDRVYAIGTAGDLACFDVATGKVRWRRSFVDDFDGRFMAMWKFSESPLVDGDRLICTPGGPEATMVALNKLNGEVIWKCAIPDLGKKGADGAGYSSAVAAEICGVRQYVQMVGRGVIGVEAATGRFLWGYNRVASNVAIITAPAVRGNYVFATTAYNTGSALLEIRCDGEKFQADEVYFIAARDFQNHHGGVVLMGDYVYGGHGPNRGDPACIELATGKVVWKERAPARGSAAIIYADGHLIYRYDRGEVFLIEATPDGLKINGRFETPEGEGPGWPHPVVHQGKLYLRHANLLFCYDVRAL